MALSRSVKLTKINHTNIQNKSMSLSSNKTTEKLLLLLLSKEQKGNYTLKEKYSMGETKHYFSAFLFSKNTKTVSKQPIIKNVIKSTLKIKFKKQKIDKVESKPSFWMCK